MNILELEIVNNRKIKCFIKKLAGDNLEISGDTGQGKTTAISALWDILEKRADALTHGQKKGTIRIKLGDSERFIVATREITPKTSTINIMDSDGKGVSIADFKQMISDLSINPHQICQMKPKQRTETLLKAANLGDFDLIQADADIAKAEADRLNAYRTAESLKVGPEPEKVKPVSVSALVATKDEMEAVNAGNQKLRDQLDRLKTEKATIEQTQKQIQTQLKTIEEEKKRLAIREKTLNDSLSETTKQATEIDQRIAKGADIVEKTKDLDTAAIRAEIANAESVNKRAAQHEAWKANNEKYEAAVGKHREADEQVKVLAAKRKEALDNAKWPLEGLEIIDGDILYNGCLFDNLGESETMLVCAALAISDIKAHKIKVVRMDRVESMSKADYEKLRELFNGEGIQVLSTRVSRGDVEPNEIVIVDGEYKS